MCCQFVPRFRFGLCYFKGFYIDLVFLRCSGCKLGGTQFFTDIARKVFIGGDIVGRCIGIVQLGNTEDNTFKLCGDFFLRQPRQLCHKGHIYLCFFGNGNSESFRGSIHACNFSGFLNRPFGEHIRFGFEIAFLVHIFKRAKEVVRIVLTKSNGIATAVNQPIFCGKAVIELI